MIVRIARNYDFPDLKRQTPNNSFEWNGFKFTEEEIDECDILVVLNYPKKDLKVRVREGGTLLLFQEPPYDRLSKQRKFIPYYDYAFTDFDSNHPGHFRKPAALPWHIGRNYDELVALKPDDLKKDQTISCVTSNTNVNPGHQPRLDFLKYLQTENFDFDLMGRGFNPIEDKFDGIAPYKYSIAIENYQANDYWTEKIVDCFLSFTMPIYHGCSNMEDYFPAESFIKIDINDPEKSLAIIKKAIADNSWEKNLEAIKVAREKVLNEYQFFPFVVNFFKQNPPKESFKTVNIPHYIADPKPPLIKRVINKLFK